MSRNASNEVRTSSASRSSQEFSRILTAAVINAHFRQMLLSNPAQAVNAGYAGEAFHLPSEEKKRLTSIRATTLADFANQLTRNGDRKIMSAFSVGD